MEIGPIFRTLIHNKTRFVLIALEVALTLAIVVNCVNMILDIRGAMHRPSGMDEDHVLALTVRPFGPEFADEDFDDATRRQDVRTLQALPGVRSASLFGQLPLSGGGSSTGRKPLGSEAHPMPAPYFQVTREAIDTLGVELVAGRGFEESDYGVEDNENVILSQALADKLFPDGDALGRQITSREGTSVNTVVGIVAHMLNSWPHSDDPDLAMLVPAITERRWGYHLLVRARPEAVDDLYTRAEEALLAYNPGRAIDVRTLGELRAETFQSNRVLVQMLTGVMALLVLITALGIVGLTSFSVTQRTRQIGVRRALGATRGAILRYFLTENWIVTTIGIVAGAALAYLLNYGLMQVAAGVKLGFPLVAVGALSLWTVGLLAALSPALRGTHVAPVVATRSV